jgi:hypothetical protein
MPLLQELFYWFLKRRLSQIEAFKKEPVAVQERTFNSLIDFAKSTEWGEKYGYSSISTHDEYQSRVPVSTYEDLYPYFERLMKGEQNLLWSSEIRWFSKSSGTTNARSKFIPVSMEALDGCHFQGGKDIMSLYLSNVPETLVFKGKGLSIGGSLSVNEYDEGSFYGDISAVVMRNLPLWAQFLRAPHLSIALMDRWEEKIEKMAQATVNENITSILGVPTWTIVLIQRILELSGARHIHEVWPNLEVFVHGAVAFEPYRELFSHLAPSRKMHYMETYNASEGFFGLQDDLSRNDMLLMLDYGVYYEFIPAGHWDEQHPKTLNIGEVELGKNYAILISTNSGLWRYKIGDTVKFTSLYPHRIRITGRTKHFINAFGEELIIENAEHAITQACEQCGAEIVNFTAAPVYFGSGNKGAHEWAIEFERMPVDQAKFVKLLDEYLRKVNSDYDAKRYLDMALTEPLVHCVPKHTFHHWLKSKGKLGGQNKVPRLSNDRQVIEEVLSVAANIKG